MTARMDEEELGCPRLKTRAKAAMQGLRRCVARWEDEGVEAELMGLSEGQGSGYGGSYGDRRRGMRSAVAGEREGDEGESERG